MAIHDYNAIQTVLIRARMKHVLEGNKMYVGYARRNSGMHGVEVVSCGIPYKVKVLYLLNT